MSTVISIICAILIFCVIVVVHEFGHFIVARKCGIDVKEFAIGMGPAIFKKQGKNTLFTIRILPLGGYCSMDEDEEAVSENSFRNKSVWRRMAVIAAGCGAVSILFCIALKLASTLYTKYLKNPYVRVVVAALIVMGITFILQTDDYMGAGNQLIAKAIETGRARPLDFVWKIILTAITMRAGFRGGEIVPAFCVGATFGCVMGQLLGFPPVVAAAAGMVALFCGVTNCPITSMLISFELFGFAGVSYYLIAISISYALSGYYSLYKDQTIVYSKYKAKYINRKTR